MNKFLLFICLLGAVSAWWDKGHMLVAQIALNRLTDTNQFLAIDRFKALIQAFNGLTDGRSNTWAEAAVWPDDIKDYGADMFDNYHFTNIPYDPDYTFKSMNELQIDVNSFKIINFCTRVLSANIDGVTFQRAFMARYLMHVVGDIHQPLHNTNLFNETYPDGDLGGNRINVTTANNITIKLHNYFDSIALYQDPNNKIIRPLNENQAKRLQEQARTITRENSYDSLRQQSENLDSHHWAVQTFQIARDHIYEYIANTNKFDEQYQKTSRKLLFKQIALAGYRLANVISGIYKN